MRSFSSALWALSLFSVLQPSLAKNELFEKMCKSAFLDIPFGLPPKQRYNENSGTCTQEYALVATQEQAEMLCYNAMPYDVNSAKTDGQKVTCIWGFSGVCPNDDYLLQVYDMCYRVSSSCYGGDSVASPKIDDQIRWISRAFNLFGQENEPLLVKPNTRLNDDKIKDRYYDGGVMHANDGNTEEKLNWAMVVTPNRIGQIRPGQLVKAKVYMSLCEKREMKTGSSKQNVNPLAEKESVMTGGGQSNGQGGNGRVFATRNDYQPRLLTDGAMDLEHFHFICGRICTDCIAASGEILNGVKGKLAAGSYWVPVTRKSKGASNDCNPKNELSKRKSFKSLLAKIYSNKENTIPLDSEWMDVGGQKWPRDQCSDADRFAVQYLKQPDGKAGYVDAPVFDRKPILCYEGIVPTYRSGASACYKNSEMKGGKCQCKHGFTDAVDNKDVGDVAFNMGYREKGFVCVGEPHCTESREENVIPYKAFIYLGDGSHTMEKVGTWAKVLPFLQSFEPHIPKHIPVYLVQWTILNGEICRTNNCPKRTKGILEKGWTRQQFMDEAEAVFGGYMRYSGMPYDYIVDAANWWKNYKQSHGLAANDKAFMVFVSDAAYPSNSYYYEAIQAVQTSGMKVIAINTGGSTSSFLSWYGGLLENAQKDQINLQESGYDFDQHLKEVIIRKICKHSRTDVLNAI